MVSTHVALERRGWAKSLMRDAGCFGVAVAHTDESSRGCAAPVGGGFRSEVVVGCLKNRFCIYTRTRTAVCCTLRILSTARAGRPNLVHRHRRHTGALYNAADTRLAALPSCGHLLGVRLSRAAKLQRQSRGCTVRLTSCFILVFSLCDSRYLYTLLTRFLPRTQSHDRQKRGFSPRVWIWCGSTAFIRTTSYPL